MEIEGSTAGGWRFVFDSAAGDTPQKRAGSELRDGRKRARYTVHNDCKKRKVKCSGEIICRHCRARQVQCIYESNGNDDAPETSEQNVYRTVPRSEDLQLGGSDVVIQSNAATEASVPQRVARNAIDLTGTTTSTANNLEDPELFDRVTALERMVNHLVEWSKSSPEQPAVFQASIRSPLAHEDGDENNMFAARVLPDDLSLSSQVTAMGALLSKPSSPKPSTVKRNSRSQILVEFPDPATLQHLFHVFFSDFDSYFPFLDRDETEARIFATLRRLGFSANSHNLLVPEQDLSIISLTCLMLAMAECLDSGEGAVDADSKPGWQMYMQGTRAVQRFFYSNDTDIDVARTQCITAAYLMHCGALRAASNAVSIAFQMATAIKLNDQRQWPGDWLEEPRSKQYLWWIIYFLDRRIAQKSGSAYHIRDVEFLVADFGTGSEVHVDANAAHAQLHRSPTDNYIQALINIAGLWSQIWDAFFAVGTTKKSEWLEIEIMDAKIINVQRTLPEELKWDAEKVIQHRWMGEPETNLNRRLHIYTRIILLRMLIRQNPLSQTAFDPETAYLCARFSREVIQAHNVFMQSNAGIRAVGYFTTASLVECVYHLAPVLHYSKVSEEHNACIASLKQAHKVILKLSTKMSVAKRALRALKGLIEKWAADSVNYVAPSKNASESILGPANTVNAIASEYAHDGMNSTLHPGPEVLEAEEWLNMPMGAMFGEEFEFNGNF